ncbi:MAG: hypothetical protein ACI9QC_000037 [Oceanicoccus sp.]|jgi:hypothetical protein
MVFLFRRHKTLSHKQSSTIGFTLAVISLLSTAVITYCFPRLGAWLNLNGVFHLDFFLLAFMFTVFAAVQGLLLFGFPLFYAKDKKSHMTGFQIMLYSLLWMIVIVSVVVLLYVFLGSDATTAVQSVTELTQ